MLQTQDVPYIATADGDSISTININNSLHENFVMFIPICYDYIYHDLKIVVHDYKK